MRSRAFHHLLLALLLLLAQLFAAAHALSHQDEAPLPDHACAVCAMTAHLGSALPSAAPVLEPAVHAVGQPSPRAPVCTHSPRLPFHARAPPATL
jgi:hypothetical protein